MLYSLSVLSLAGAAFGDATCHAISPVVTDAWCRSNCGANPPNCPAQFCDCSAPTPPPPPPTPTPPTPPAPPPPPTPPPSCSGSVVDGWFLAPWASSSSGTAPSSSCMAIYFWGLPPSQWAQFVKSSPDLYTADVLLPGKFPYKVLNLGGGGTSWDDTTFEDALNFLPALKSLGYTGVCLDGEVFPANPSAFTMSKMLGVFAEAKKLGLTTVLTSTAEGPYYGCDSPNDCWSDIVWDDIDFMVPQMYGASGATYGPTEFEQYANFWKQGGGQGVHGKFAGPKDLKKILWAVNPGQGQSLYNQYSFAGGYIEWAYKNKPVGAADTVV